MLNVYTVSFFGHRMISDAFFAEVQIENLIRDLLASKEYVDFLVGRNGDFDLLVSSTIKRLKNEYRDDNSCHILVLPYNTAEYRNNYDSFNEYYDQVDIYKEASESPINQHFKNVIVKWLIVVIWLCFI